MNYEPSAAHYDAMRYNRCGRSGLKLPAISLGLWHNFGGVDVFETGRAMVRRAFDLGITHSVRRKNFKLDPILGSCVKHRIFTCVPISSHPTFSTNSSRIIFKVIPCSGLFG